MVFEKLFGKPKPEVQKAIDAATAEIRAQGDAIKAQIRAGAEARKSAMTTAHEERMGVLDSQIADRKREMDDIRTKALLGGSISTLRLHLSSAIFDSMTRGGDRFDADVKNAVGGMRREVEIRTDALKENLSQEAISALKTWALEQAGNGEKPSAKIEEAFLTFIKDLEKDGFSLESS